MYSSRPTVESVLVEITERSQRGAEAAESLLTNQMARLQHQRASLQVNIHLSQLLQTTIGPSTHEHRSAHYQVIQTGKTKGREIKTLADIQTGSSDK